MTEQVNPKIIWLCRRGMKELDEVLKEYLEHHYLQSSTKEQQAFQQLLNYQDRDIVDRLFYGKKDENLEIEFLLKKLRH